MVRGLPTKVPITVRKPLRRPLELRGLRCSDGKALRLSYRSSGWYRERSAPPASGRLVGQLQAGPRVWGYPGYAFFHAPGRWRIDVRDRRRRVGSLVVDVVTLDKRPVAEPRKVPLMRTPPAALLQCRSFARLRPACPTRIPRVLRWSALARDDGAPFFHVEVGAEHVTRPELNRPPRMLHLYSYVGEQADRRWAPERRWASRPVDGILRLGRFDPVFLGRARWAGRRGDLVLAPPFPNGGMAGNHLIFRWRARGGVYGMTLHAWEPFSETVATLRAVVESTPR